MKEIIVYSSDFCPYCSRAKSLLQKKSAPFRVINVDFNPDLRAEMRNKAGGRNSVPQIFIGGEHIGGCDDLHALDAKGGLDPMLAALR